MDAGGETISEDLRSDYDEDMWDKGYAGCSASCEIEDGYVCVTVDSDGENFAGLCSGHCGNNVFEGAWPEIGRDEPQLFPEEFCDDGNNVDGDGCSALCVLEDPYG